MQKPKRAALYVRVSTADQTTKAQESELREYVSNRRWSLGHVYADQVSGVASARPALDQLLVDARKRKFDCVLVWRIDRLGRSVPHLLGVLETLKELDIEFISFSEAIDTSTPTGMMVFTVLAAVASLERSILVERVRCGLDHARRRGVRLGRPPIKKLDAAEIREIRAERAKGATLRVLARKHQASVWTVHRAVKP
jgi:DNA invertase Pin-like site-specific DNA recombinase